MVKKGVSAAEKRDRMVEILREKRGPITLKEAEKLGSKAGVNTMTIKGVLQELVDDNIIEMDKIGSTNYFWYFPSKLMSIKHAKLEVLKGSVAKLKDEIQSSEKKIETLKSERKETKERKKNLDKLSKLRAESATLLKEIGKYNDLEERMKLDKALKIAKEACNRWTDNTWALADYLKKKFGASKEMINSQLRINDEFDYPVYVKPRKKQKLK